MSNAALNGGIRQATWFELKASDVLFSILLGLGVVVS